MSTHGPFSSGPGFTVYKDEPKTNGRGTVGPTGSAPKRNWSPHLLPIQTSYPLQQRSGLKRRIFCKKRVCAARSSSRRRVVPGSGKY